MGYTVNMPSENFRPMKPSAVLAEHFLECMGVLFIYIIVTAVLLGLLFTLILAVTDKDLPISNIGQTQYLIAPNDLFLEAPDSFNRNQQNLPLLDKSLPLNSFYI